MKAIRLGSEHFFASKAFSPSASSLPSDLKNDGSLNYLFIYMANCRFFFLNIGLYKKQLTNIIYCLGVSPVIHCSFAKNHHLHLILTLLMFGAFT